MKPLLFIALLIAPILVRAQYNDDKPKRNKNLVDIEISEVFPVKDNRIFYSEVVSLTDSVKSELLFIRAKKSLTEIFKSAKDVIQMEDSNAGIIVAKGFISTGHNPYVRFPKVWFKLKIEIKDNRYKYTLTDVVYSFNVSVDYINRDYEDPLEIWATQTNPVKQKVKDAMNKWLKSIDNEFNATISRLKVDMSTVEEQW